MKKTLIVAVFALTSFNVFAETRATFTIEDGLNGGAAERTDGSLYQQGNPFSSKSDLNGVCKFMKFESYVPDLVKKLRQYGDIYRFGFFSRESNHKSTVKQPSPVLNREGLVSDEIYTSVISEITCTKP